MKFTKVLVFFTLLGLVTEAKAYLTYQNGRIDRALYDGHEPKTVVVGNIAQLYYRLIPNPGKYEPIPELDGGPMYAAMDLTVQNVIMGDRSLIGKQLSIDISSFTWPEDLVKLDTNVQCIFIIREYKDRTPTYLIEVVIPCIERTGAESQFPEAVADNKTAILFLEEELLDVLGTMRTAPQIRETLLLLGPILQKENIGKIEKYIEYKNDWVIRTALACIVYASQSERHLNSLARNIEAYFSLYDEHAILKEGDDLKNYSAHYAYYTYVFFLDPGQRNYGTRWDDTEAFRNKETVEKLKATGLISKRVSKTLKID